MAGKRAVARPQCIGVLALQGAVREHIHAVQRCGVPAQEIKYPEQLETIDGLILPGGESTTMAKLMQQYGFFERLLANPLPIMGTCAGLILLAKRLEGQEAHPLGFLDVTVQRNAYGRQVDSFEQQVAVKNVAHPVRGVFIRAPRITAVGQSVHVLAVEDQFPVVVRQGNVLGVTFHPELTDDVTLHQLFLELICE